MRNIRKYTFLAALLCCAAVAKADGQTISHNFNTKYDAVPSQLTLTSANKVGTTDDNFVYTCSGTSAEFGYDLYNDPAAKVIAINLPNKDNQVVVSPPIERLDSMLIYYYYPSDESPYTGVKVALSTDGVEWEMLSGSEISYHHLGATSGSITASFGQDTYYVKIWNSKSKKSVSLISIEYHISPCTNCFRYRP